MHVYDKSEDWRLSEESSQKKVSSPVKMAVVASAPMSPLRIPRTCREAMEKYLKLTMQCMRYINRDHLTELLQPVYAKRALI